MKKKLKAFLIFLLALSFIALPVRAEGIQVPIPVDVDLSDSEMIYDVNSTYFEVDNNLSVSKNIYGSSFIAGNTVNISGNIDGILFGAGNSIRHDGNASYALIAGNIVEILGSYEKDAIIAGNSISVRNEALFKRDVLMFSNTITLSGVIERDITIYAARVDLENVTIKGNAKILADVINFSDNAKIEGNLETNIDVDSKFVGGEITKVELDTNHVDVSFKTIIVNKIVSLVSLLATFVALFLVVPKLFDKTSKVEFNFMKVLSLCGTGLVFLVFVPLASIFVMTTVIGLPISLITLALYCIALYLSNIFTGYYVGQYMWKNLLKKDENALIHTLIGITLLFILSLIPYIGALTSFVSFIVGLGLIVNTMKKK